MIAVSVDWVWFAWSVGAVFVATGAVGAVMFWWCCSHAPLDTDEWDGGADLPLKDAIYRAKFRQITGHDHRAQ